MASVMYEHMWGHACIVYIYNICSGACALPCMCAHKPICKFFMSLQNCVEQKDPCGWTGPRYYGMDVMLENTICVPTLQIKPPYSGVHFGVLSAAMCATNSPNLLRGVHICAMHPLSHRLHALHNAEWMRQQILANMMQHRERGAVDMLQFTMWPSNL